MVLMVTNGMVSLSGDDITIAQECGTAGCPVHSTRLYPLIPGHDNTIALFIGSSEHSQPEAWIVILFHKSWK